MLKKTLILLLGISTMVACQQGALSSGTQLNINAPEGEELIVYRLNPQKAASIDTVAATSQLLQYPLDIDTANFYMITIDQKIRVPLFVNPGDEIDLNITKDGERYTYKVSGSDESERIMKINALVDSSTSAIDSMAQAMQSAENAMAQREVFQEKFEARVEVTRNKLLEMIDAEPGRISNLFIWPQSIGRFQLVPAEEYLEYYEKVAAALPSEYPNNPHVPFFAEQVEKIKTQMARAEKMEQTSKNIVPGQPAPDIAMEDTTGTVQKLSDLKGQVVLVDFWASWCRPCRQENPFLVETYNQYKDQGFTVFSVSLDGMQQQPNPREAWIKAIESDELTWPHHVSDLKAWQSPIVDKYGFQGIPYTVLVDREGNIIGTNLRGPALRDKLAEVFGS